MKSLKTHDGYSRLFHFPSTTTTTIDKDQSHENYQQVETEPDEDYGSQVDENAPFQESIYAPLLIVIDFDNTLAVVDDRGILEKSLPTNFQPNFYSRPFMVEFLKYLKYVNSNNVLILWTAGTEAYINQGLFLLNIAHYFDQILSRRHCRESGERFGGYLKSYKYLIDKFPQYKSMRSVLVDNCAFVNGNNTGYTEILSVKPYCLSDVVKTYGIFGTDPGSIKNIPKFLASGGAKGKRNNARDYLGRYRGDVTLLSLILYLQNRFFNIYVDSEDSIKANIALNKYLITSRDETSLEIIPLNVDYLPEYYQNIISLSFETFFMGDMF